MKLQWILIYSFWWCDIFLLLWLEHWLPFLLSLMNDRILSESWYWCNSTSLFVIFLLSLMLVAIVLVRSLNASFYFIFFNLLFEREYLALADLSCSCFSADCYVFYYFCFKIICSLLCFIVLLWFLDWLNWCSQFLGVWHFFVVQFMFFSLSLQVFVLFSDGSVYILCPLVPFGRYFTFHVFFLLLPNLNVSLNVTLHFLSTLFRRYNIAYAFNQIMMKGCFLFLYG